MLQRRKTGWIRRSISWTMAALVMTTSVFSNPMTVSAAAELFDAGEEHAGETGQANTGSLIKWNQKETELGIELGGRDLWEAVQQGLTEKAEIDEDLREQLLELTDEDGEALLEADAELYEVKLPGDVERKLKGVKLEIAAVPGEPVFGPGEATPSDYRSRIATKSDSDEAAAIEKTRKAEDEAAAAGFAVVRKATDADMDLDLVEEDGSREAMPLMVRASETFLRERAAEVETEETGESEESYEEEAEETEASSEDIYPAPYEITGGETLYFILTNETDRELKASLKAGGETIFKKAELAPASEEEAEAQAFAANLNGLYARYEAVSEEGSRAVVFTLQKTKFEDEHWSVLSLLDRWREAELHLEEIAEGDEAYEAAGEALDQEGTEYDGYAVFDLSFERDGEKCRPKGKGQIINVMIESGGVPEGEYGTAVGMYGLKEAGEDLRATRIFTSELLPEATEEDEETEEERENSVNKPAAYDYTNGFAAKAEGSVQFSFPAESLTLFAASWKALEPAEEEIEYTAGTLRYEGSDYTVELGYDADAEIPGDAYLDVEEIDPESEAYKEYLQASRDALAADEEVELAARFFDITIRDAEGNEIQPQAQVSVQIDFAKPEILVKETAEATETAAAETDETAPEDADEGIHYREQEFNGLKSGIYEEEPVSEGGEETAVSDTAASTGIAAEANGDILPNVLHFDPETGEAELVAEGSAAGTADTGDTEETEETEKGVMDSVSFETENFSVYGVVYPVPLAKAAEAGTDGAEETPLRDVGEEVYPRQADGSSIESISAKWITADTVDNDDRELLYVRPSSSEEQSVRLQVNYALSGEHNYAPGDVTITVPAYIFKNRDGNDYGTLILPFPEEPSTRGDFNWRLIGDQYVLTNTKAMSAATKGYMQFAFSGLMPYDLVDMAVSEPFDAYIEVVTHLGNTIALKSNELTAQFDTEARVTNITKKLYGSPQRVSASAIPAEQRALYPGETEFIKVDWYVFGTTKANTLYTLDIADVIPQEAIVSDGKPESEFRGFVVQGSGRTVSADGTAMEMSDAYHGARDGQTSYYYLSTAYPASQFEPDVNYTFHNNASFTVTEEDPEAEVPNPNVQAEDPQLVTTVNTSAQVVWMYTAPKWENPTGHFMVYKNGNDDTKGKNRTHNTRYSYDISDLHLWSQGREGWYGIYPSALNDLQDEYKAHGTEGGVRLSYTIDSVGYVMPWMFDSSSFAVDGEVASRLSKNYNRPVTMVTEDRGFSIGRYGEKLLVGTDYDLLEVEFPADPYVYYGKPQNINPDGSWAAMTAGDGTFKYTTDNNKANWPDILLQIQRDGEWEDYATANWKGGSFRAELAAGGSQASRVIKLPEGTENIRTIVTLQNTSEDAQANVCLQAAIDYDIRPVIRLKSTEALMALIEAAFENSNTPSMIVYNAVNMSGYDAEEDKIVSIDKDGYDSIRGYTTDTMVYPSKSSWQSLKDVDVDKRIVTVHYSAKVEERSVINDKKTWEQAVEDGRLIAETRGVWRDLLPKGVTPLLDTVKLRDGDRVTNAYTEENYNGSGRTLLVVEADLSPVAERYRSGDMYYYEDVPAISFDAFYDFDSLMDYGDYIHNVISFESGNDFIGTVKNYSGEPDDPNGTGNVSTPRAFADDAEKGTMTDLDPERDTPSFVYAGTYTKIDILSAARTSLSKDVMVNNDGLWSDGLYYNNPEENKRTVYEGGQYSYRLRMMSDDETISKDLVLYDSLENFYAGNGNDAIDIDAPRWQGTFIRVDVSQLEDQGCAPVVYYSTVEGLQLSDETDPDKGNAANMDLMNGEIWTEASAFTGDREDIKAIAVDASKKTDGTDFSLAPLESAMIVVHMQAPSGKDARAYLEQKGEWGDSAQSYNNAYLLCTSIDKETLEEDSDNFVHKDYTKVGLTEYKYKVTKVWNDDNDRDGKRPASVTLHLYADGKPVDGVDPLTLPVMETVVDPETGDQTEQESWTGYFEHIPYTDADGRKIHYSAVEEEVPGYVASIHLDNETQVTFTNSHTPEKTQVSGQKSWVGDTEAVRPESITVELYANGRKVDSKTFQPDSSGNWSYSFTDLYKYENKKEITYTVKETMTGLAASYTSEVTENPEAEAAEGHPVFNLINTYHPKGDLMVTKAVEDTTEVSAEKQFAFTFSFTKEEDGETVPVFDEYEYDILEVVDGTETAVGSGTLSSNSVVEIKGGQKIHVKEVDQYVHYTVSEAQTAGFKLSGSSGAAGSVAPNQTTTAAFTNQYEAKGQINLEAKKTLKNRELQRYQFRFDLYQVTTDSAGNETEELLRSAANARPESGDTVIRDDGTVESSSAGVIFGAIRYTQADHGRTYTYRIKERIDANQGYTYDESIYDVEVTVTDNGDGTLNIAHVYKKENETADTASFVNEYKAEGEIVLRAWKDLQGRKLKDEEFTFELLDKDGNAIQTKTNTADGSVVFEAIKYTEADIGKTYVYGVREKKGGDPSVNYSDQVFGYTVEILDNGDGTLSMNQGHATPVYESKECETCQGSGIDPFDQEVINITDPDHPMIFGTRQEQYVEEMGDYFIIPDLDVSYQPDGDWYIPDKYPFMEEMAGGEYQYETGRHIETSGNFYLNGDYNIVSEIRFHGQSEALANGWKELLKEKRGYTQEEAEAAIDSEDAGVFCLHFNDMGHDSYGWYYRILYDVQYMKPCKACGATGEIGEITGWNTGEGELPVFVNTLKPGSLAVSKHVTNAEEADPNQQFTFHVKLIGENVEDGEMEYTLEQLPEGRQAAPAAADSPVPVPASDGGQAPDGNQAFLGGLGSLSNGLSLTGARGDVTLLAADDDIASGTMGTCSWVIDADGVMTISPTDGVSGTLASYSPTSFGRPSWYSNRGSVRKVVVEDGVSAGEGCYQIFEDFRNCTEMDLSKLNTSNTRNMERMFRSCTKLTSLDLSMWDVSNVRNMDAMFCLCEGLTSIDVSGWNTSNVTDMTSMFQQCRALTTLDVSGFDTSKVTCMAQMFYFMNNLEELDISGFDTSNVVDTQGTEYFIGMQYYFQGSRNLKKITLGEKFRFNGKNITITANKAVLMTPPSTDGYTGKWIREGGLSEPLTSAQLRDSYTSEMAGTWVWEKKTFSYRVKYVAEGATGSMADTEGIPNEDYQLPANKFGKFGYTFDHWEDGSGNSYTDRGTIQAGTYQNGDTVTLTAVFEPISTTVNMENGEFTFTLPGNARATFPGIPAGTAYQVWEETPDGWILIEQSNVSGSIEPLETAQAEFINRYEPGVTTAQFAGTKKLDGLAAEAEAFSFELTETGATAITILENGEETTAELPLIATTQDGGFIQFPIILYKEPGEHTYTIREIVSGDDSVDYDRHTETITVTVKDNGDGTLSSETAYDADGISFDNKTRPGILRIQKRGVNVSNANKESEFTFKVRLNNAKGLPLGSGDSIYWYIERNGQIIQPESQGQGEEPEQQAQNEEPGPQARIDFGILKGLWEKVLDVTDGVFGITAYAANIASGTSGECSWVIDEAGVLTIRPTNGTSGTLASYTFSYERWATPTASRCGVPWASYNKQVTKVVIEPGVKANTGCSALFQGMSNCTEIVGLENLDVSAATNLAGLFWGCSKVTSLDVTSFDTSNVVSMAWMFSGTGITSIDVTGFNTSKLVYVDRIFNTCTNLTYLDISTWNLTRTHPYSHFDYGPKYQETLAFAGSGIRTIVLGEKFKATYLTWDHLFLNNPPTDSTTGRWIHVEGAYGPYAPKDLTKYYTAEMAGTWVWEQYPCAVLAEDGTLYFVHPVVGSTYASGAEGTVTSVSGGEYTGQIFAVKETVTNANNRTWDSVKTQVKKVIFVDDFNPRNTSSWFNGFTQCTEMDLSKLNTSLVGNMSQMFNNCNSLSAVVLGEDFKFNGNNITTVNNKAVLPTPPNEIPYTGKWIRQDETYGPFTPAELRDNYTSAMTGTWIRELDLTKGAVVFNANGGYTSAAQIVAESEDYNVTMPDESTTTFPHYALTEWNTEQDGNGTAYTPGETYNDVVELGKTKKLYAQWADSPIREYTVRHYQQNSNLNGYRLYQTEKLKGPYGTEVTPDVKTYSGFGSPEPKTVVIAEDDSTVVDYYYDRASYKVEFVGNGATSGQMEIQTIRVGISTVLSANTYQKHASIFTGWNTEPDGSGTSYSDRQRVRDLSTEHNAVVKLYAQWLSNEDSELQPEEGIVYVRGKAGDVIVIPGLPAGTTYSIEEVGQPSGWTETGRVNADGSITANRTGTSTFTNTYRAEGVIVLEAHKKLLNGELQEGQFNFVLLDGGYNVISTASNSAVSTEEEIYDEEGNLIENQWKGTAPVRFDPLHFTQPYSGYATYTYYIQEVPGDDELMEYDEHRETVLVRVNDNGDGTLTVTAEYDQDGALFTNDMQDTALVISKETVDDPGDGTEFAFTVDLKDAEGNPLDGEYKVRRKTSEREGSTVYSHTPNVDDKGIKGGDYGSNVIYSDIVTIPGAEHLHVELKYSTANSVYGSDIPALCFWAGAYPQAAEAAFDDGFNPTTADRGYKYDYNNWCKILTDSFDIEGDTVTIYFQSYGFEPYSEYYPYDPTTSNYGYYAVISDEGGWGDADIDTVRSGDTVRLKGGETIKITGLPNGTKYTVTEEEKEDWELTESSKTAGTLQTGEVSEAVFTNTYRKPEAEPVEVQFYGHKTMKGGVITEEDDYSFVLMDASGETLQTRGCDEGAEGATEAGITFDPVTFTEAGTYVYYIQEQAGADTNISCDKRVYEVTVTVTETDGGKKLSADTVYEIVSEDADGQEVREAHDLAEFVNVKGGQIRIRKVDGGSGETLEGAKLQLVELTAGDNAQAADGTAAPAADGTAAGETVIDEWTSDTREHVVEGLKAGSRYVIRETEVPGRYLPAEEIRFSVAADSSIVYDGPTDADAEGNLVLLVEDPRKPVEVSVTKVWDDTDDRDGIRPASVKVRLLADGKPAEELIKGLNDPEAELSDANKWTYSWTELPQTIDGAEVEYSVEELEIPAKYTAEIQKTSEEEAETCLVLDFTVTNTHVPGTTAVNVKKAWEDNDDQDGIRPAGVKVQLLADGKPAADVAADITDAEIELNAENGWSYGWKELPESIDGAAVKYSVVETEVPEGYMAVVSGSVEAGFTVTNKHTPEKTQVQVTKAWNDEDDKDKLRPASVKVQLLADGKPVTDVVTGIADAEAELDESNKWTYTWTGLPKNSAGNEIVYTVQETAVPEGYEVTVSGDAAGGYTVTNTHLPEETTVKVTKVWDDGEDQDKLRPASVKVQLLADGVAADTIVTGMTDAEAELNADNQWIYTWTGLPKKADGKDIVYTVKETAVPEGYEATVSGSAAGGYTITNTHTPEKTRVQVTKVWDDGEDQDKLRPASVKVQLLADGVAADTAVTGMTDAEAELNADNQWTYTWTGLPKNIDGKDIVYTVKETAVPEGYEATMSGSAAGGYTITNTHTPEEPPTPTPPTPTPPTPTPPTPTPPTPTPPTPTPPTPTPPTPTPPSGGNRPHRDTDVPSVPTTPTEGVLGESRLPDFVRQVLGDYRMPQGVLGASRMGDDAAVAFAGTSMLLALAGMILLLFKRRRKKEEKQQEK